MHCTRYFKVGAFATDSDHAERGDTSTGGDNRTNTIVARARRVAGSVRAAIGWIGRVFCGEMVRDMASDAWTFLKACVTETACPDPEAGDDDDSEGDDEDDEE